MAACTLCAFAVVLHQGDDPAAMTPKARTVAFVVLACSQLFHSFNCRNLKQSLFKIRIWTNPQLVLATGVSFSVQIAVVHFPFLQQAFKTTPLSLNEWGAILFISSLPLWLVEIGKAVAGRRG